MWQGLGLCICALVVGRWEANQSHSDFAALQRREDVHYKRPTVVAGGLDANKFRQEFVIVKGGAWK